MSIELTIRPARPEDRPAMERICGQVWEGHDYVPYVWEEWLEDERGPLIVGEVEGNVVALSKITFDTPEEAWLQGMRVDAEHRRHGIAGQFLEYSLAYARERGARAARLSTAHDNTPVHIIARRAGMERIGVYVFWMADALPEGPSLELLSPADGPAVESFLRSSPVLAECHGVYGVAWHWQELTAEKVARLLENRQFAALRQAEGRLAALAAFGADPEDQALDIGFVDGEPDAVARLALAFRAHVAHSGQERARAWLPEVSWLREAFQAAGYGFGEWKATVWLFERRFEPGGEEQSAH